MTTDPTRCAHCGNAIPDPVQQCGEPNTPPVCIHCWLNRTRRPVSAIDRAIAEVEDARDRVTMPLDW